MAIKNINYWRYWWVITIGLSILLVTKLTGDNKTTYLPGETSNGHYQIEKKCTACHSDSFGGEEVLQTSCMNCHKEELRTADDSHPKSKFVNPRNAAQVQKLDARKCVTCHVEHKNKITQVMGVTLPNDFCFKCHQDVAKNRPSHKGLSFSSCASAGCHNFHDNRSLYEDFLAKHLDEPALLDSRLIRSLPLATDYLRLDSYPSNSYPIVPLDGASADVIEVRQNDPKINQDWMLSAHKNAGVNCTACHQPDIAASDHSAWGNKPNHIACFPCHTYQSKSFTASKHGMRLAQDLSPMSPSLARSSMKKSAFQKELSCVSCHSAHRFDRRHAAVDACLGCHNDEHSKAYKQSSHFKLWYREVSGLGEKNTGVSCATCHFARKEVNLAGVKFIVSEHNQNEDLRPNEKMIRTVCMQCHGLGFSIDALADRKLILTNFSEKPSAHIKSLEMVKRRIGLKKNIEGM